MPAAIKGKDRGAPSDFVEKAKAKVKKKKGGERAGEKGSRAEMPPVPNPPPPLLRRL